MFVFWITLGVSLGALVLVSTVAYVATRRVVDHLVARLEQMLREVAFAEARAETMALSRVVGRRLEKLEERLMRPTATTPLRVTEIDEEVS